MSYVINHLEIMKVTSQTTNELCNKLDIIIISLVNEFATPKEKYFFNKMYKAKKLKKLYTFILYEILKFKIILFYQQGVSRIFYVRAQRKDVILKTVEISHSFIWKN